MLNDGGWVNADTWLNGKRSDMVARDFMFEKFEVVLLARYDYDYDMVWYGMIWYDMV